MAIEETESPLSAHVVLTTRLYADGTLIKETTDETVWCAVLNKIVATERAERVTADDDILDSLFHSCALAAYLDQAAAEQGWPDCEATRRRAFRYYEEAIAEKNRHRSAASPAAASEDNALRNT